MSTRLKTTSSQANLRLIAEKVGLSMMTVSRALRGVSGVSDETRRRVLEIARENNYTPNMLVTGMRTGRTWTAGVMMPVVHRFFAEVVGGVYDELAKENYAMILAALPIDYSSKAAGGDLSHLMPLIERRVDGLIFRATDDLATDKHFGELRRRRIPFVTVDRNLLSAHCDFVGTDDYSGGVMAAQHLLDLGHRNLGHLAGPGIVSTSFNRRRGFEDTIRSAGAVCTTIEMPDFVDREAAIHFLDLKPRPTAVFCVNDPMAYMLYSVALVRGVRIPQDLSVVGFADLRESALTSPGLTTIRQDPKEIGRCAVQLLLERISSENEGGTFETIQLKPSMVKRESTAQWAE